MTLQYFGTDGIRGNIQSTFLQPPFVRNIGRALGHLLQATPSLPVLIGRDTRHSGPSLERWLKEGLSEMGISTCSLGVVPTPAISLLIREKQASMGIAITASHNPASDNGLKFFDSSGIKFGISTEKTIETWLNNVPETKPIMSIAATECDGPSLYINKVQSLFGSLSLKGWKIVIDCANGATSQVGPKLLSNLGATVITLSDTPDGHNINHLCGSESPYTMKEAVKYHKTPLGVAYDGDGDRIVACDERGSLLDGTELLGILTIAALESGCLSNRTLVTTAYSNLGLDRSLNKLGIKVLRVSTGDRNVVHKMREVGANLGGESSGHFILGDHSWSGDGLIATLQLIQILQKTKKSLSELRKQITLFPQIRMNLKITQKRPLETLPTVTLLLSEIERRLGTTGRVFLRYSGTELNTLRILLEASSPAILPFLRERLLLAIEQDFGKTVNFPYN